MFDRRFKKGKPIVLDVEIYEELPNVKDLRDAISSGNSGQNFVEKQHSIHDRAVGSLRNEENSKISSGG